LEYLRKNKKHQFTEDIEQQEGTSDLSAGVLSDMGFEELLKMISELPPGYRTVFNLFAVEGYSHKEIAELLGITESTSKTQFFKAKAQLRQQIEKTKYASERSGNTTRTQ
jgi:RNA polymerase sigma-70 factor (ECF subfamily)